MTRMGRQGGIFAGPEGRAKVHPVAGRYRTNAPHATIRRPATAFFPEIYAGLYMTDASVIIASCPV